MGYKDETDDILSCTDGVGGWEESGVDPSHFSQVRLSLVQAAAPSLSLFLGGRKALEQRLRERAARSPQR